MSSYLATISSLQCNKDNNAGATKATAPVQCWQWCQHNEGIKAIMTTAKTPAHQQRQQHHRDEGDDTGLTMATTPSRQGQQGNRNNDKDTWATKMPAH
jgi:hypothetical protein